MSWGCLLKVTSSAPSVRATAFGSSVETVKSSTTPSGSSSLSRTASVTVGLAPISAVATRSSLAIGARKGASADTATMSEPWALAPNSSTAV